MKNKPRNKKWIFLIPLVGFLVFGLGLGLTQAQSDARLPGEFELASTQLERLKPLAPVISMDFQNANLKDVLKVFSQQARLNFIASENIKDRRITLYLDRVSVEDALKTIMSANNLTYEQSPQSSIFVVKEWGRPEVETITRIYPLQYARVKGYELNRSEELGVTSGGVSIQEVVESLITEHGRVIEDSRTNSLIITDVPTQFETIEDTIAGLDIKLPQVMIEAEIIETTLATLDRLGIEWGSTTGALFTASGATRDITLPFSHGTIPGTVGTLNASSLGGTLAMLKRESDTRILARPKILTLNNQTALIKITANQAVSSGTTISSAGEGISAESVTVERYETGITLMVTPQINNIGEITMSIEPSVVNVRASVLVGDYYDPHTRSAATTVTVRDGETVVIGGLINTEDERILRKVPFFADIPLLGNLWRKKDDTVTDKELVIFITPHLVIDGTEGGKGLVMKQQVPWEYNNLGLKEAAMDRILDNFED